MTVHTLQVNMTRGEVTPYVHARVDAELYQAGLALARNFIVTRFGGMTRVPGTIYYGPQKHTSTKARFIPFNFNAEQVYAIEAGVNYFRFWVNEGRIESPPGTPVEVVTPYAEADLKYLQVRQSGDVIYIWCKGHQPRTLTRMSETSWVLAEYNTLDGPYLPVDTNGVTITLSDTNHFTPDMTANNAPSGTASGHVDAWHAFDRNSGTTVSQAGTTLAIAYQLGGGATKVPNAYWLQAPPNAAYQDMPTSWTMSGSNDGVLFTPLDSRQGEAGWSVSERRYYEFENENAYEYIQFEFTGGGGDDADPCVIAEIAVAENGNYMVPGVTMTLSATTGINGGTGLQDPEDLGRSIRILGSDGKWRFLKVIGVTSPTVATVRIYGHALPDTRPISTWRIGAWGDAVGWPAAGAIFEDRLTHANSDAEPLGIWSSVSADYDNFRISTPIVADDSVDIRLTGGELNDIRWMVEGRDILAGTAGSLRAVGRANDNEAFGPLNVRQRNETTVGASIAPPIQIENMILFMDVYETRLYEAGFTYEVEGYLARELSALNEHLFGIGVDQIAYQSHPHRILWGRRLDGKLVAATYDRDQKVFGVTLVDYGGEVESIMAMRGSRQTDIWMTVKRTVPSGDVRHIERTAGFYRTGFGAQLVPVYGTGALVYQGAATDTVTGLDHLNGNEVGVLADGRDVGTFTVSGGEITLPDGFMAETIVVGRRIASRLEGLRLEQIGNQDGTGLGRKVNILNARVDIYDTGGFKVGSLNETNDMVWDDDSENDPYGPHPLRTGMFSLDVNDSWRNSGVFVIETDSMYPVTVRAVSLEIEGEP